MVPDVDFSISFSMSMSMSMSFTMPINSGVPPFIYTHEPSPAPTMDQHDVLTMAPNASIASEYLSTESPVSNSTVVKEETASTGSSVARTRPILAAIIIGAFTILSILFAWIYRLRRNKIMQESAPYFYKDLDDFKTVASERTYTDESGFNIS
jgi:hypothetical protein